VTNKLSASDHVRNVINKVTVCAASLTCPWYVRLCPPSHQSISHQRQATVCIQCLVGLHQCNRKSSHWVHGFQRRSIRCGYCPPTCPHLKNNVVQQTRNSLLASCLIPITYCTTFYRHLQLPRSTMVCDFESTTDNYQLTLDTSQARTSSLTRCTLVSISSDCLINCQ